MRRKLFLILFLALTWPAIGQEFEATITLDTSSSMNFDLSVLNSSPAETIESVGIALTGAVFDTENSAGFPGVPALGTNNDGVTSAEVTWTPASPLLNGGLMQVSGDIDSVQPSEVIATVNFTSGAVRVVPLSLNGVRWQASISESATPGLIINGQATATLSWTRPTQNEDGTPLAAPEIAGYVLYWGTASGVGRCGTYPTILLDPCYGNALDLQDGGLTTTPLQLSLSGDTTIYFAMTAYTRSSDGNVNLSAYSNEAPRAFTVQVTFPDPIPGAPELLDVTMVITCTTNQVDVTCSFTVQ